MRELDWGLEDPFPRWITQIVGAGFQVGAELGLMAENPGFLSVWIIPCDLDFLVTRYLDSRGKNPERQS